MYFFEWIRDRSSYRSADLDAFKALFDDIIDHFDSALRGAASPTLLDFCFSSEISFAGCLRTSREVVASTVENSESLAPSPAIGYRASMYLTSSEVPTLNAIIVF